MSTKTRWIAVVAGATRGCGRGIARALGERGAIVYCTGRSTAGARSSYNRPETIEETAALVTAAGGRGIPVRVDHGVPDEVEALFALVEREQGRLDILADSVAGMDPMLGAWDYWGVDLSNADRILHQALLSHVITAKHALPLITGHRGGLIVEVTEGDTLGCGGNVLTFLAKTGLKTLALSLAETLRSKRTTVVAVTPGFLRSEMMLEHFGVTADDWREAGKKDPNFLHSETPMLLGRGVAALAADPERFSRSGQLLSSWELARNYGVDDLDGTRPDWGTHFREIVGSIPGFTDAARREAEWLELLAGRNRALLDVPPSV
ncbi:MAG: SDR family oxidoreductase [Gemmatimonadales bacterium]